MTITAVEKFKGRSYNVFVDDEYFGSFDVSIISMHELKAGKAVSEEDLNQVKWDANYRRAKERALYLLEYRDHSRNELIEKLCKNTPYDVAGEVADRMEELGFLNDLEYAKKLANKLMIGKSRGERRVLWEMQQKGVDKEIALEALAEVEVDPVSQLVELIEKKYARKITGEWKDDQKVVAALARLGHSYDDIKSAMNIFKENYI